MPRGKYSGGEGAFNPEVAKQAKKEAKLANCEWWDGARPTPKYGSGIPGGTTSSNGPRRGNGHNFGSFAHAGVLVEREEGIRARLRNAKKSADDGFAELMAKKEEEKHKREHAEKRFTKHAAKVPADGSLPSAELAARYPDDVQLRQAASASPAAALGADD